MPDDDQILLAILAVVIVANILLLATIPLQVRARRRSLERVRARQDRPEARPPATTRPVAGDANGPSGGPSGGDDPRDDGDARAAAAIEAFVAEVAADASGSARPPAASEVMARRREVTARPEPSLEMAAGQHAHEPVPPLRGLADPASWDRAVRDESARVARFGRPVTVVMAELADLDDVADRLGRDVADRVAVETARLLASKGRAVDPVAWLGDATFGILLLETEETRAAGYVDRMRAAADDWLESAGLSVRLSLGWASPAEGGDVMAAAALARQRMLDAPHSSTPVARIRSA